MMPGLIYEEILATAAFFQQHAEGPGIYAPLCYGQLTHLHLSPNAGI
jgi:hypothetical protein